MLVALVAVFIAGYICIAMEHSIKIDKSATALLLGMLMWVLFILGADSIPYVVEQAAQHGYDVSHLSDYINQVEIIGHLGDISSTLFFLIGAMTIVELIDSHGGFTIITRHITTRHKLRLVWILSFITFFMSSVLDNLTTSIVMVMLLRKLINDQHERWLYASMIIIAANAGGAWSPIGDITTIMLWVNNNVTTGALMTYVLVPSLAAVIVPLLFISFKLRGQLPAITAKDEDGVANFVSPKERSTLFYLGVGGLIFVPIFKTVTHLPPFVGMLFVLGIIWIYTELMYNKKALTNGPQNRLSRILQRIDMPTILFFLGILMAVAVLQATGILGSMADWLDEKVHNIYIINVLLGCISSIIDNVPLVAAAMGMYEIVPFDQVPDLLAASDIYRLNFVQDGGFWLLLSYCAGVGGSMLIIGSAAGVVVMGLEKMNFGWYLKHISWLALLGYLAGAAILITELIMFPPIHTFHGF